MKLHEYLSKKLFAEHGIPIPRGKVTMTSQEAKEIARELGGRVVIKSQVLVGGRGKAGGIQFAETLEEVESVAAKVLEMKIKGLKVGSVWVEEKVEIKRELYFGVTIDRSNSCYVTIASTAGGMNIEEVAEGTPEKVIKTPIDPLLGFKGYHARQIACKMDYLG